MLSSRFAGIPISSSTIDGRGLPQLLIRGERAPSAVPAQVAGFISEWWPASNRNDGRLQIGIGGRIASEFAQELHYASNRQAVLCVQSASCRRDSTSHRRRGKGRRDPARDVGCQSAGLSGL